MESKCKVLGGVVLPHVDGHIKMVPFDLATLVGLPLEFVDTVKQMLVGVSNLVGTAYFTIHGKTLYKGQTLRRGGPHTDGNYEPIKMGFGGGGGNGWKVGENGPPVGSDMHARQYASECGGIILASNYESCLGWDGDYYGLPSVGGDCSHIRLDSPFNLMRNTIYYGNNHFIHESLPVNDNVHRIMARITMPENHVFN